MRSLSAGSFGSPLYAIFAMIGASFCWATGSVLTASLVKGVPPVALLFVQLLGSNVFLWCLLFWRGATIPRSRRMVVVGSMGVIEPGLTYLCSTAGLQSLSASASSLIFATEPLMVALLAWCILRERLSRKVLLGFVVSVVGISLTLVGGVQGELAGALLMICSTALAALYVVCNQCLAAVALPLTRAASQQLCGLLLIGSLLPVMGGLGSVLRVPTSTVLGMLASGVIQYALAFWLYLIAVQKLPVTIATLFLSLIPVFVVIEGGFFLGETLTALQWIGAVMVVGALGVVGEERGKVEKLAVH